MSEETTQQAPTKEELIKFFQEQIDVKKVQLELQQINAQMAVARAEELKALSFIAQVTNPNSQQPHIVTQEDIDANPELVEAGVQVGDEVMIPSAPQSNTEAPKSRKLKKEQ